MDKALFSECYSDNLPKMMSVFDFVALCYEYIQSKAKDESIFISMYIDENEGAKVKNPNKKLLGRFSQNVYKLLIDGKSKAIAFEDNSRKLINLIRQIENKLKPYENNEYNYATIPYYALMAVDRYQFSLKKRVRKEDNAPLNKCYCNNCYIYLKMPYSLIDTAKQNLRFPDKIDVKSVRMQLDSIVILEKHDLWIDARGQYAGIPKTIALCGEGTVWEEKIRNSKRIRIAMIPFDESSMLDFPVKAGSQFTIRYNSQHLNNGAERAVRLLNKAIELRANVIVFPEFICHAGIQEKISSELYRLSKDSPEKIESLMLVIAGSAWTDDDNNVSYFYDSSGRLLGTQYKTFEFYNEEKQLTERLTRPGAVNTFIDVEEVGRIGVRICKDISIGANCIKSINDLMSPQFLFVPAWSKSMNIAFYNQAKGLTESNHETIVAICNCCEALQSTTSYNNVGLIVSPYKNISHIEGVVKRVQRKEGCNLAECKNGGCIHMIDVSFATESVNSGEMAKKKGQYYVNT